MVALIFFTTYLILILIFFKIGSISQSYYELEKRHKHLGKLFTLFTYIMIALVLPKGLEYSEDWQFLIFLAAAGLGFVGTAPIYDGREKNREEKIALATNVHYLGALICMIAATLWVILATNFWPIPLALYSAAAILSFKYKTKYLLLIEIAAFYSLLITLYLI